jgi:hypothetical protein
MAIAAAVLCAGIGIGVMVISDSNAQAGSSARDAQSVPEPVRMPGVDVLSAEFE